MIVPNAQLGPTLREKLEAKEAGTFDDIDTVSGALDPGGRRNFQQHCTDPPGLCGCDVCVLDSNRGAPAVRARNSSGLSPPGGSTAQAGL